MDRISETLFNENKDDILHEASSVFDIRPDTLKKLGSFESIVYEFEKDGTSYILKLTHDVHRSKNQILGELDWTNYLGENGVRVPRSFPSVENNLVESFPINGSEFFFYVQEKAPGNHITEKDWNSDLFVKWGRLIGRMNFLTKSYVPSSPDIVRPGWYDDSFFNWEQSQPDIESKSGILDMYRKYIRVYKSLSTDPDSYGLIHSDLHQWNFYIHDGDLIAFDFDDSRYDWFAHDIAIPLFYSLQSDKFPLQDSDAIKSFFRDFLEGYTRENTIHKKWLSYIPLFLKTRELDLYFIIKTEQAENDNEWCRRFMDGRKEKIINDIPVIELDFTAL